MKLKNKKGFTLLEITVVIGAIVFLMGIAYNSIGKNLTSRIDSQVAKDYIVTLMSEVEGYSYNSITVGQEFLKDDNSLNTDISRFGANTSLAYYHGLYFSTNPSDPIDGTAINGKNAYIYLTQYEQESYGSLIPRELSQLIVDPASSPQILTIDGYKWAKKYKMPTTSNYYLFRITGKDSNCLTGNDELDWFSVIFSTASLSYDFYGPAGEINNFDYKLCYSEIQDGLEDGDKYLELNINRGNIGEFYFENLRNY